MHLLGCLKALGCDRHPLFVASALLFIAQFFICRVVLGNLVLLWMTSAVAQTAPDQVPSSTCSQAICSFWVPDTPKFLPGVQAFALPDQASCLLRPWLDKNKFVGLLGCPAVVLGAVRSFLQIPKWMGVRGQCSTRLHQAVLCLGMTTTSDSRLHADPVSLLCSCGHGVGWRSLPRSQPSTFSGF